MGGAGFALVLAKSGGLTDHVNRDQFVRPSGLPAGTPTATPDVIALGRALFADPRLSGDGTMACATCHQPELAFGDGQALRKGQDGRPLTRHTPHLWNLAWGLTFFWDGRASSLEQQARGPLENPREMAGDLARVAGRLQADPAVVAQFARAFPARAGVDEVGVLAALAAYERTLVSPVTRFDKWASGDDSALDADEQAGFSLFAGKAQCSACHAGWRFTDEAFHDIGLPDKGDLGRGAVLGLRAADHAFKTPSLRELAWTAPYMHDGSLATLDAVIDHYAQGVNRRPTLSKDMPPVVRLSARERQQLLAFLGTLSSENPPVPPDVVPKVEVAASAVSMAAGVATTVVGQKDKRFTPGHIALKAGQSLTIVNDDRRTHNVRIDDPRMPFASNAQEPGDQVVIGFPEVGTFGVICSVHPAMRLTVDVGK
jgi:cytochrome c peroxidase